MIVKKFIAKDMGEAAKWIKLELGSEAVIISQRKYKEPGLRGFFKKRKVEVTAGIDESKKESKIFNNEKENKKLEESIKDLKKLILEKNSENSSEKFDNEEYYIEKNKSEQVINNKANEIKDIEYPELTNCKNVTNIYKKSIQKDEIALTTNQDKLSENKKEENIIMPNELLYDIKEMKSLLNAVIRNNNLSQNIFLEKMIKLDINEKYHEEIYNYCLDDDKKMNEEKINEKISKDIEIAQDDFNGIIALIGPTGVGKTTTISKIAGQLLTKERKSVGLITIDIYRIGAIQQLKEYAEIMNIPFKVVFNINNMEEAINEMSYLDVILIDTVGRSCKDSMSISLLRAYIKKASPNKTILVISSTTKNKDIPIILNGYSLLNYDNTIITKLDETATYGSIHTIAKESKVPISYITFGQNVPHDVSKPNKEYLTNLILGKESV